MNKQHVYCVTQCASIIYFSYLASRSVGFISDRVTVVLISRSYIKSVNEVRYILLLNYRSITTEHESFSVDGLLCNLKVLGSWDARDAPRWIGAGSGRVAVRGGSGGRSPRQPTCPISITSFCAGTGSLMATAYHSTNWNLFRYATSRKLADAEKCRRIRSWLIVRNTPAFPTHHFGSCVFFKINQLDCQHSAVSNFHYRRVSTTTLIDYKHRIIGNRASWWVGLLPKYLHNFNPN